MPASDLYGLRASGLPPELALEAQGLSRREAIARALLEQGMLGQIEPPQVKGRFSVPIHPLQGIAKIAQAGIGAHQLAGAGKERAALGSRYQQMMADAIANYQHGTQGTPAQPAEVLQADVAGPPRPEVPAQVPTPEQQRARMVEASLSNMPQLQRRGAADLAEMNRKEDIKLRAAETRQTREEADKREERLRRELQANRPLPQESAPVAVVTKDGKGVEFVSRSDAIGRTPAAVDPETQGALAAARGKAKLSANLPQARLRTETMTQNLDRLEAAMNELHNDPGLTRITGTVAGRTWNVTNTATGAQAKLNSIKSQIFQSSLQAMREASKTGGAVGNVSDKEGDKLERTLAALDQAQSTDDFKAQLKKAVEQVRLSKTLIKNAFDEQFGDVSESAKSDEPPPGAVRRR